MGDSLRFCNNCKKNVSRANHATHTVHCQRNVITCSLCQEPVLRSQYQQHVESLHSAIPCEHCGKKIEALNLFKHQKEECDERLVKCKYCEIEVVAREIDAHLEYCGARTDRCKGCSKYVQSRHLQFHYEHDHKYLSQAEKDEAEAAVGPEGQDGEECPICQGPITLPLALECGHVFCMVCVKGIANTTKNCAICRRDIQRDMLMDIRFCREEDIIKNYVNKSKYRKVGRSQSVPTKSARTVAKTTQEYDDMVTALMSSRTSTANCRYQRPNNGHTPSPYTPYCYSTSGTSSTITDSCHGSVETISSRQQTSHVCCSTSDSSSESTRTRVRNSSAPSSNFPSSTSSESCGRPSPSPNKLARPSSEKSSHASPAGARPRRPTTLALKKDQENTRRCRGEREETESEDEEEHQLSQIEYDRWLAFQLARAEDDLPASEFNQRHKIPMRRTQSMPESKDGNTIGTKDSESSPSDKNNLKPEAQSRLPPTSPRCSSVTPVCLAGSSSSSSGTHGTNLAKSSSDSSASSSTNSSNATGARPKSSTGLKKRVSFKEDGPPVQRQAPVMLPCEFCDEMFSERDLMRHQTSCDKNETKNPREFLESRRSSVSSPTSPSTLLLPSAISSPVLSSKPPSLPVNRGSESPSRLANKSLKTPPQSPSPRPKLTSSSSLILPRSPSITHLSESDNSQGNSRHTSVSPGPGASISSSSGIGSATSSFSSSSVSTTPSTSSSASPVPTPAAADTPTDNEGELEEEEVPLPRPRKGRLLSSAIASWRSISGSKPREKTKYTRSNTAPLEMNDGEANSNGVSTSLSVSQLPPVPPSSSDKLASTSVSQSNENETETNNQQIFVKSKNKYPAPPPPKPKSKDENLKKKEYQATTSAKEKQKSFREQMNDRVLKYDNRISTKEMDKNAIEQASEKAFKFDSKPIMNGNASITIPCEFCKEVFSPEKFQNHQAMCEAAQTRGRTSYHYDDKKESSTDSESPLSSEGNSRLEEGTPLSRRHNKGPAPKPPHKTEIRPLIGRSHSVRERSSSCARNYDYEAPSRRLERASSIRETSWTSRESSPLSRRWSRSREGLASRGGLDSSGVYSGDNSLSSSSTSLNSYSISSSRPSYCSVRDDVWSRRSITSLGLGSLTSSVFLGGPRCRDRPLSRHRASSFYGTRSSYNTYGDAHTYSSDKRRFLR